MVQPYEVPRLVKFIGTESGYQQLGGEENEGILFNRYRLSVWDDKKVLEMDDGDSCRTMGMYIVPLNCIL